MKKVMVFGTFDVLHEGHKNLFEQAKAYGDYLIAVVARDSSVLKIKGFIPKQSELERLENVSKHVDKALLGYEDDFYKVIMDCKPHVLCFGYDQDQMNAVAECTKRGIDVEVHVLKPFNPEKYKSSIIRKN